MTHDELLAKISSFTCCSGAHELALLAVVKLHRSQPITLPNGDWGMNCILCDGYYYPCYTIDTIDKELV